MDVRLFSHQGGCQVINSTEKDELICAIENSTVNLGKGYGPELRANLLERLSELGWSDKAKVAIDYNLTIASTKNRVGVCIQTSGNMSRMYADLIKLQQLYLDNVISVGAFVLPTAIAAKKLGDNLANADRLQKELILFKKVIHMPIVVFSFE